jgi:hypothetical protein
VQKSDVDIAGRSRVGGSASRHNWQCSKQAAASCHRCASSRKARCKEEGRMGEFVAAGSLSDAVRGKNPGR